MKTIPTLFAFLMFIGFASAQTISLNLFKDGFTNPVNLQNAGDDRLFVVEQGGIIKILNADATVETSNFLNISSLVGSGGERGLLGLAFHPDYTTNKYFYVYYINTSGNSQVSRFTTQANNPNVADANSEQKLLTINQPQSNHNGGCILFGPDGYLYIASGDGGGAGDQNNNAQNLNLLLGKMLRIDVDSPSNGNNYGIPPTNPFINNNNARDEIYAYGLRNPWKFSFDFQNDDLWIADVGQGAIEEINRQAVSDTGLNYGWRCYEGTQDFNTANCPEASTLLFPVSEYDHQLGQSITGGYVYRGTKYSDINGLYFFADFVSNFVGSVDSNGTFVNYGDKNGSWSSFGEDVNKELYIIDYAGKIFKVEGSVLAVEDFDKEFSVKLIPNPSSEKITISLTNDSITQIEISDSKGSIIYSEEIENVSEKNIPVSEFKSGIYFVKIKSNSGRSTVKKIIKN